MSAILRRLGSLAWQRSAPHRNALLPAQEWRFDLVIEVEHTGVERRFVEAARTHSSIANPRFEFLFLRC